MDLVLRGREWIVCLSHQWRIAIQQIPNKNNSAYAKSLKAFESYKPGMLQLQNRRKTGINFHFVHNAPLEDSHNSKFGIFYLLV